jgi:hypothetical protein
MGGLKNNFIMLMPRITLIPIEGFWACQEGNTFNKK